MAGDFAGTSVSLSADGSVVAIGADGHDGNKGQVRIYEYEGSTLSSDELNTKIEIDLNFSDKVFPYLQNFQNNERQSEIQDITIKNSTGQIVESFNIWKDVVGNNSDTQWRSYGDNSLKIIPNNTFEIGTDQYVIEIEPDVLVDINGDKVSELTSLRFSIQDINPPSLQSIETEKPIDSGVSNDFTAIDSHIKLTFSEEVELTENPSIHIVKLSSDIDGDFAGDNSGFSVSLSANGSVVAIGAISHDGGKGQVRIYENRNGTWTKIGDDIDGEFAGDQAGRSLSLSADGSEVAGESGDKRLDVVLGGEDEMLGL